MNHMSQEMVRRVRAKIDELVSRRDQLTAARARIVYDALIENGASEPPQSVNYLNEQIGLVQGLIDALSAGPQNY
jgi:hypothetical protein